VITNAENVLKSVKIIRKHLGLSQEDLARELGVSFATINRWENGQSLPSKLACSQFKVFYKKLLKQGQLPPKEVI